MKIKNLTIHNIGPFYQSHRLELDSSCTVLTGGNDVGKSIVLESFERLVKRRAVTESEVNLQYLGSHSSSWHSDREIQIRVQLASSTGEKESWTAANRTYTLHKDQTCEIVYYAVPKQNQHQVEIGGKTIDISKGHLPFQLIKIEPNALLNSQIEFDGDSCTPLTQRILNKAFQGKANFQAILSSINQPHTLERRLTTANNRLRKFMSSLTTAPGQYLKLTGSGPFRLDVVEENGDTIPLNLRSDGFQRGLAMQAQLALGIKSGKPIVLAIADEPDLSLHPDSQHQLRRHLERVFSKPGHQLIYVTHSPSMINPRRPSSVVVVEREFDKDQDEFPETSSRFRHHAPGNNFAKVRSSLGITATDSLLYAPICVVVEGDTELMVIQNAMEFLAQGDEELGLALELAHYLDGKGWPSLYKWCTLVASHGEIPIAFCDGDRLTQVRSTFERGDQDFDLIHLEEGQEIEDLISPEAYFEALGSAAESESIDFGSFSAWLEESDDPILALKAFTKQVGDWLDEVEPEFRYRKPAVVARVIDDDPKFEKWDSSKFHELASSIKVHALKLENRNRNLGAQKGSAAL